MTDSANEWANGKDVHKGALLSKRDSYALFQNIVYDVLSVGVQEHSNNKIILTITVIVE